MLFRSEGTFGGNAALRLVESGGLDVEKIAKSFPPAFYEQQEEKSGVEKFLSKFLGKLVDSDFAAMREWGSPPSEAAKQAPAKEAPKEGSFFKLKQQPASPAQAPEAKSSMKPKDTNKMSSDEFVNYLLGK